MAKKHLKQIYRYKCTITDEEFKTTRKVNNPDELVSVNAYYDLHPDMDDRPEHIKIEVKNREESKKSSDDLFASLQGLAVAKPSSGEEE